MTCKMLFFDYRKSEEQFFQEHKLENYDIKFFTEPLNEKTLEILTEEDFNDTMIISVFVTSNVNEKVLSKFKNLRVISTRSTGYNHICLNTCVSNNIGLINVDSYGSTAVAQYTITLMMMLVRNIYPAINAQIDDSMHYEHLSGRDMRNLTIGVIGTGAIGCAVCSLANTLGLRVLASDIKQQSELVINNIAQYTDLSTLLKQSDVVTIHIPYTNDNYNILSKNEFEMMKDNSYLINTSRGELVDTNALLEVAETGKFSGIALDVIACQHEHETKEKSSIFCPHTSEVVQKLMQIENVIITPHIAYNTQEAVNYILQVTFDGISDFLSGGFKYRVL